VGNGGAVCNLPGFRRVSGFSILVNFKSSALPIVQSTFKQQQQQRNRAKLHKHNICISPHLNQTNDDRNVTANSFKIDYHHISLSQAMHYIKIRKMC